MRRQERKNAVRLQKMTRHRLRIQQFALTIRSTLHTRIIANNQRKQADRRAGLFRAFLAPFEIPAQITFVDRLPLTAKGSVDRAKLAQNGARNAVPTA